MYSFTCFFCITITHHNNKLDDACLHCSMRRLQRDSGRREDTTRRHCGRSRPSSHHSRGHGCVVSDDLLECSRGHGCVVSDDLLECSPGHGCVVSDDLST